MFIILKSLYTKFTITAITILITLVLTQINVFAQENISYQKYLKKGDKFTTFSISYTGAEKEEQGNQEFEQSFKRFNYRVTPLYLITDKIGLGPIIGYEWLSRELLVNDNPRQTDDFISRGFEYGLTSAYFVELWKNSERAPNLYLGGGVSWLRTKSGFSSQENSGNNTEFGYTLYTGLYVPIGSRIGLNWRLERIARERQYTRGEIVNGNVIITDREKKWPSTTSLSVGFNVKF